MDLFGDLPETSNSGNLSTTKPNTAKKPNTKSPTSIIRSSPFRTALGPPVDLFGDLPATASTETNSSVVKRKSTEEQAESETPPKKKLSIDLLNLNGYVGERQGERNEMQDSHVIIDDFTSEVPHMCSEINRLSYYAVFDGHGGSRASKFAADNLHKQMAQNFPKGDIVKVEAEIKRRFIESYKKTDEDFLKEATKRKPSWKDGSTATSVLVINNTCYIANIGDSKAILCRYNESSGSCSGITLTKDHNPIDYEERMRIQKAGGHVKDGRFMGILEVSRSFGDGPYKKHGISVIPDVKRCTLTKNDRFILIACDGLWKTFDNDSAIQTVNEVLSSHSSKAASDAEMSARYEQAAQKLAKEAVRKLSADNVTVVLVRIR